MSQNLFHLHKPVSDSDWRDYFDLRWRVLRAPWNQPIGSEQDEIEDSSTHLMISNDSGRPVAVGRFHFLSPTEAQIRFMAVAPEFMGAGFGSQILKELERLAKNAGAKKIVLNARTTAADFYLKQGYQFVRSGETLFDSIEHVVLSRNL